MALEQLTDEELYAKGFEEKDVTSHLEELEQPEEENSEDSTEEIDEEQEDATETEEQPAETEETEETNDESDEDITEETETEESDSDESEQPKYKITISGQEVELSLDEMKLFAQKGGDYTRKTQDLAKSRADIELMNEKGLSHEDLVVLADILSGNEEALATLANKAGINPLNATDNGDYKPVVAERNFALEDVVKEISEDKEHGSQVDGWVSALPTGVKEAFVDKPELLKGLHIDAKNGMGELIMPEVIKQLAINPNQDFRSLYGSIGQRLVEKYQAEQKATPAEKPTRPVATNDAKKKASVKKGNSNSHLNDHKDVWNDDELYASMKDQLKKMKR